MADTTLAPLPPTIDQPAYDECAVAAGIVISAWAAPFIRIDSLTITKNRYCLDRGTKTLYLTNEHIRHDLADPASPGGAVGISVEAFRRGRESGVRAFTATVATTSSAMVMCFRQAILTLAA